MTIPMIRLLPMVKARWGVLLLTFAAIVGAAAAASLLLPKRYTAEAEVVVDVKSPDPIAGVVLPGLLTPGYMATQIDIARSERLALMVVDRLDLAKDPAFIARYEEEAGGAEADAGGERAVGDGKADGDGAQAARAGSMRQYLAELLLEKLQVKPGRDSSVMRIAFSWPSADFAASVANAFASAYVDTNIEMRVEPATQQRRWFEGQSQALREDLDAAQRRLSEYQRGSGIVSADEGLDVETRRLQELSTQHTAVSAEAVEAVKRQGLAKTAQAGGEAGQLPDVVQSPVVQQLKADQTRLESRLSESAVAYGTSHPEYRRAREELEAVNARLKREMALIVQSLDRSAQLISAREIALRAALEEQRRKVLQMKQARDELQVLQRDVDNARGAYESVSQRVTQVGLESQATHANVFILKPATAPSRHSSPQLLLNLLLAGIVGSFLAVGVAVLVEYLNRRVLDADDLVAAGGVPILGKTRKAKRGTLAARVQGPPRLVPLPFGAPQPGKSA